MGFPANDGSLHAFASRTIVGQVSDEAGAVRLLVYKDTSTTDGRGAPEVLRQINLSKTDVDGFIAAFQTT